MADGEGVDLQRDPFRGGRDARREQADEPASEHHRHDLAVGQIGHGLGPHGLAVAQHGHPVGDAPDLVHAVRDVEDELARVRTRRAVRSSQSTWRGSSADVASSRMRISGVAARAPWRSRPAAGRPMDSIRTGGPGSMRRQAEVREQRPGARLDASPGDGPQRASASSDPNQMFSATVRSGMSDSSWKTVAIPAAARRPASAAGMACRRSRTRPSSARTAPAEDPDERALAGPVLTEDGMHFAGSGGEVHLVEGDDAAEALADGLRLEQRRVVHPVTCQLSTSGRFLGRDVEPVRARRAAPARAAGRGRRSCRSRASRMSVPR